MFFFLDNSECLVEQLYWLLAYTERESEYKKKMVMSLRVLEWDPHLSELCQI